jgi:GT2 family glycosyltransferase
LTPEFGTVSVIIPTWNRADLLSTILANVREQTYPIEQTIVVDNGSTDGSALIAEEFGAFVIRLPDNQGFAAAVNRGLQVAATTWVAIFNNDLTVPSTWISTIVGEATRTGASFGTGKLLSAQAPGRIDGTYDLLSRAGTSWRRGHGRADGPRWNRPCVIQFASFTAILLSSAAVAEVGYLDERFESYMEDIDWCLRCAAAGRSGRYIPSATALHIGSATLGAWQKATAYLISRNQILIYKKHLRSGRLWPVLVGQLLWCLLALRHGAGFVAVRAKIDGLRQFAAEDTNACGEWIRGAVEESEQQILEVQRQTGFDTYWRLYFALTRQPK